MPRSRWRPPASRGCEAELPEDGRGVEVDALAGDAVAVEQEERHHPARELATRRRHATERSTVRAEQVELDHDRVVGVVDRLDDVPLVGEGGARGRVVAADGLLAVVDLARGDQLVARTGERPKRRLEVVAVLRLHVLPDDRLAPLP